jgi:hypothetical protein
MKVYNDQEWAVPEWFESPRRNSKNQGRPAKALRPRKNTVFARLQVLIQGRYLRLFQSELLWGLDHLRCEKTQLASERS